MSTTVSSIVNLHLSDRARIYSWADLTDGKFEQGGIAGCARKSFGHKEVLDFGVLAAKST